MRRSSLGFQVFLAILGVSLATTLLVGLFARTALARAFDVFLSTMPSAMGMVGRGMGRVRLAAAEQTFIASVDRSVFGAALLAMAVATVVALLLAAYLNRPLRRLEDAAEELAGGDLSHRVDVEGPAEVASIGDAFNRMADSLEQAEELRRRMVADVAHELRNPLAAARAQAEGMAEGILPVEETRLTSLVDDLVHLSALIDDLQELAVADAGRLRYEMAGFDLIALAKREVDHAQPLLAPGVVLGLEHAGGGSAEVIGDERRIAQVLRNLLSNATRHTSRGSIAVSVAQEGDEIEVRVCDTGEGISEEDLVHVFERFYRTDSARATHTGGAGLGLAISRAIILDHGGSVFAEATPGGGATVGFRLPSGVAPPEASDRGILDS
jgi:signal transduction histidine kinase